MREHDAVWLPLVDSMDTKAADFRPQSRCGFLMPQGWRVAQKARATVSPQLKSGTVCGTTSTGSLIREQLTALLSFQLDCACE